VKSLELLSRSRTYRTTGSPGLERLVLLIPRSVYNVIGSSAVPSRFSTAATYACTFSWDVPDAVVFCELQQGELGVYMRRADGMLPLVSLSSNLTSGLE